MPENTENNSLMDDKLLVLDEVSDLYSFHSTLACTAKRTFKQKEFLYIICPGAYIHLKRPKRTELTQDIVLDSACLKTTKFGQIDGESQ